MTTEFSGKKFGWQAARRGAIFLLLLFGVPLELYAADKINDPDADITLTEAIRVTTATPLGFYAYLLLLLSLVRPVWKRMKSLSLPGYLGLIVPFMMFADVPYFLATDSTAIFGVSIGDPDGHLPPYLMTAVASIVAMTAAHPPPADDGGRRFGFTGAGALVLAVLILLGTAFIVGMANWLHFVQSLAPDEVPHPLFVPMLLSSAWVPFLNPYVCALFGPGGMVRCPVSTTSMRS